MERIAAGRARRGATCRCASECLGRAVPRLARLRAAARARAYEFALDRERDRSGRLPRVLLLRRRERPRARYRTVGTSRAVALASTAPTLEAARERVAAAAASVPRARVAHGTSATSATSTGCAARRGRAERRAGAAEGPLAELRLCKDGAMIVERALQPAVRLEHLPRRRRRGRPGLLHRRRRPGRAADRGGRAPRARAHATCCSPTTTSTTSARSGALREPLAVARGADQLASRSELLCDAEAAGAEAGRRTACRRSRRARALQLRRARGACPAHARPHRRDALVPGGDATSGRAPRAAPSPAASRRRGGRVHRRHAVQGLGRRRAERPGHTTYTDLRDSIMGTLMELPPDTIIYPGHADPTHGRAGVGLEPLHPRLARPRPRGLRALHRARRARHARAARRATTTAARRPGCAGRTARTTSFPARASSRAAEGTRRRRLAGHGDGP